MKFIFYSLIFVCHLWASTVFSNPTSEGFGKVVVMRTCKYPTSIAMNPDLYINDNEEILATLKCMQPRKKLSYEAELQPGSNKIMVNVKGGIGKNKVVLEDGKGNKYQDEISFDIKGGETKYFLTRYFEDSNSGVGAIFGALGAAIEQAVEGVPDRGVYLEEQTKSCIESKGKKCPPIQVVQSTPKNNSIEKNELKNEITKTTEKDLSIEEQLINLKNLYDKGLISKEVYEEKQAKILDS